MQKVAVFSVLLIVGITLSQWLPAAVGPNYTLVAEGVQILTMIALSFIMIHVGYEFEIDKDNLRQYGWDYVVAMTAAAFPWLFCCGYFVFVMMPSGAWSYWLAWKESLLASRFAAPTSAGVLFSMLAAAGLSATWLFRKARILAIFDDLDTVLLMVPLKMMMVGLAWQLGIVVFLMVGLLYLAWRYLHRWHIPHTWPWVLFYGVIITGISEAIYIASKRIDYHIPIHLEVLLPAFVLGCMMARPEGTDPHVDDSRPGHQEGPESPEEQRVATIISAIFMVLVGLNMPPVLGNVREALPLSAPVEEAEQELLEEGPIEYPGATNAGNREKTVSGEAASLSASLGADAIPSPTRTPENTAATSAPVKKLGKSYTAQMPMPSWSIIAVHVIILSILANLGKMFPAFCYRREASWQERMAVAIGLWPRGEVGAGVLILSLSYGIGGPIVTVAMLCLALNLCLTGVFIMVIKRLIAAAEITNR